MRSLRIFLVFLATLTFAGSVSACLTIPAPSKTVTSIYGWRFHPVFKRWRLHRGVDLRAPINTTLIAAQNGVVQVSSSASGGNEIRIVGDDGTVTRYLHLTRPLVEPGTRVSAGKDVALSGNTGHASAAPHLHFEVYQHGSKGDVNPEPLLCGGATRKPGADSVDGFPVKACNPDGGQCGGDGSLAPATNTTANAGNSGAGATSPSSNSTSGGGATVASANQPPPPGPDVSQFDDMSTVEILSTEVSKRFGNPDWYKQQAERTTIPLLVEYAHMYALERYMAYQKAQSWERIETLLATRLARKNRTDIEQRLQRQRESAAKAGQ